MDPLAPAATGLLTPPGRTGRAFAGRCLVLFLPAGVLVAGALADPGPNPTLNWLGVGLLAVLGLVLLPQPRLTYTPTGMAVIAAYVLAQVWLWYTGDPHHERWFPHLALGLLLIVPLLLFAGVSLERSGAPALRRARLCVGRLLRRGQWPADLSLCQTLPEVTGLRESVVDDATSALALLANPRAEVRAAALAALAYRPTWRPGEAERVQVVARRAGEPPVRAAAVRALANSRDPFIVETIAAALRDSAPEVRRAAAEVLLWDGERRWGWVRFSVHAALADVELRRDGPLPLGGVILPEQAVRDLQEWAGEGGGLGVRAAQTLVAYYAQILNARPDALAITEELRAKVLATTSPTPLRVELAQMLADQRLLDPPTRDGLMATDNPVPVRLVGAEAALAAGPDATAAAALREIARRPNREIALAVAQIVQRRLGVDMGIDLHHVPQAQSRRAAEITRKVMEWAAEEPPKKGSKADLEPRPATDWDMPAPEPPSEDDPQPGPNLSRW
jgi:HEAT repeat protein